MKKHLSLLLFIVFTFWGFDIPQKPFRKGKDYALFFAVNTYQSPKISALQNPIKDAKRLAQELKDNYGFQTEVVENPTYEVIEQKLKEYNTNFAKGLLDKDGQLLIFFSGHGSRQLTNGYFLPANANPEDLKRSAFNYKIWRDDMDAIDCKHILVAIDACYSGTFDPKFGMRNDGLFGTRSGELTEGQRLITEHEKHKTRLFFTSGETDQPTPDQSDFAKKFLAALISKGYDDGILTSSEIFSNHLEKAAPRPRTGEFGSDEAGASFLFIVEKPPVRVGGTEGVAKLQKEADVWQRAKTQNTIFAYKEYIRLFPKGDFVSQAQRNIKELEVQEEPRAWAVAKEQNTPEGYKSFLEKYPLSIYAETAKERAQSKGKLPALTRLSFEPEMVAVEGGTFQMGAGNKDTEATNFEKPYHAVTLNGFYIGKYEVTQAQWKAVMGDDPSTFTGDNLPVESVNYDEIQVFLQKISEKTGKKYRLPTEAEWEYAAKGGNQSKGFLYSGSNTFSDVAWTYIYRLSDEKSHPVGTKQANELGIYDMTGNVWEWCSDLMGSYDSNGKAVSNPKGSATGSSHIRRGGSWDNSESAGRVTNRAHDMTMIRRKDVGFRVVLEIP